MNNVKTYIVMATLANLLAVSAGFWFVSHEVKAVRAAVQPVADELKRVGTQVELQRLLINRALGKELLVQFPPDVEGAIKEAEDRLRTESTWPKTAQEVQQLNDRLSGTLEKLPPWAQEELLPRLLPTRWNLNALWILNNDASDDLDALSSYVQTAADHVTGKPAASSDEIAKRLASRRQDAEDRLKKAVRKADVDAADSAIKDPTDLKTLEAARLRVDAYEDEEAKTLAAQLRQMLLSRTIGDEIEGIRAELAGHQALTDPALRAYAAALTREAVMHLRLRAKSVENPAEASALNGKLGELAKAIATDAAEATKKLRTQDAEKAMRYQKWALEQIRQVREFSKIMEIETSSIRSLLDRKNRMSAAYKQAEKTAMQTLRLEMMEHMAPIDPRMLDEAVSQWFRKVYQERFGRLNSEEQFEAVKGFATTVKKWPE